MKKYAKIITALLLLTLCVSALCACFYNNDENDNSDNSSRSLINIWLALEMLLVYCLPL